MISEKINEVKQYFADKLLEGNYEFISCDYYTATINIEGYELAVWISNDQRKTLGFFEPCKHSIFMPEETFDSDEKRSIAWEILKPKVIEYKKQKYLSEKEKIDEQINKLNND